MKKDKAAAPAVWARNRWTEGPRQNHGSSGPACQRKRFSPPIPVTHLWPEIYGFGQHTPSAVLPPHTDKLKPELLEISTTEKPFAGLLKNIFPRGKKKNFPFFFSTKRGNIILHSCWWFQDTSRRKKASSRKGNAKFWQLSLFHSPPQLHFPVSRSCFATGAAWAQLKPEINPTRRRISNAPGENQKGHLSPLIF